MRIDDFWRQLAACGVDVPLDVQRKIGLEHNQERVLIRPPADSRKTRVLELGTTVPAAYVARKLGITVRTVQRHRRLLSL